jgi:hypothetical protein
MMSDTPMYDALMDEFYPCSVDLELPDEMWRAIAVMAHYRGVPQEMMLQDIISDGARKALRDAG